MLRWRVGGSASGNRKKLYYIQTLFISMKLSVCTLEWKNWFRIGKKWTISFIKCGSELYFQYLNMVEIIDNWELR